MQHRPETIIVPLDMSELATRALDMAAMLAVALGSRLIVSSAVGTQEHDALQGYATKPFEIKDAAVVATSGKPHHLMARPTGHAADEVAGVAFRITPDELAAADTYEVSDYTRIAVRLKSGLEAFVYVGA